MFLDVFSITTMQKIQSSFCLDHPKWDKIGEAGIMLKDPKSPNDPAKNITEVTQHPLIELAYF